MADDAGEDDVTSARCRTDGSRGARLERGGAPGERAVEVGLSGRELLDPVVVRGPAVGGPRNVVEGGAAVGGIGRRRVTAGRVGHVIVGRDERVVRRVPGNLRHAARVVDEVAGARDRGGGASY